jgi:hypothetical protein
MAGKTFIQALGTLTIVVLLIHTNGYCRFNLPDIQKEVVVSNEDHKILKKFFISQEVNKSKKVLTKNVNEVLMRNLPDVGKSEVEDSKVRLIYIEEGKEGNQVLALLVLGCNEKDTKESSVVCEDRLFGLEVEKDRSAMVSITTSKSGDSRSNTNKIVLEKEVRIGGLTVIGVNFMISGETNPSGQSRDLVKQERIQFFVFDGGEVRQAGSVIKSRIEATKEQGKGDITVNYNAGIVFKKDMIGNIVGILSPFTEKFSDGRVGKGMIRFAWNPDRKIFVRE